MQFKDQGGKVQVLLYSGFDEAKQSPLVRIVGSFDKYTYKPSAGLLDKLTLEQGEELQAEWRRRRQAAVSLNRQHYINALVLNIRGACDSLEHAAALSPQQSVEIWNAMHELASAMREAGYPRPTKNRPQADDPKQSNLFD